MKKFYMLIIGLIMLCSARAQWIEQNSGTTNNLRAVHFIDTFNGFAVGDSGTILKTNDGGANWIRMVSGTNEQLNTVFCVNENYCYVAGNMPNPVDTISTILKSTDGGLTWYNSSVGAVATAHQSIYFFNQDVGYSVGNWAWWGSNSTQFKTTDGGLTWIAMPNLLSTYGRKVTFLDADTGYILTTTDLGFGDSDSDIFKTTDGGETWILFIQFPYRVIIDLYIKNSSIGYAIDGWGNVFKLTESGGAIQLTDGLNLGSSIFFSEALTGYIAGGYAIQKTTDGGLTWTATSPEITASCVYFPVPDTGYAVGDGGIILKTTNGGGLPAGLHEPAEIQSSEFAVKSYPNPFSNFTTIEYELEHNATVNLSVYNHLGQQVALLVEGKQAAGRRQVQWDAGGLPAGIYFYQLRAKGVGQVSAGKVVLK